MPTPVTDIAITGIDCRFPGAPDKDAFWNLLRDGLDGVGEIPDNRWNRHARYAQRPGAGRMNTREGGFITDADSFDNDFFGITPREAAAMDPQQRILLECAWRTIEDSGVDPRSLERSRTGVFVGIMGNEWAHLQLRDYDKITAQVGSGNGYCMTANRVSYQLDLRGPSVAVDTACSSSLVALHQACAALRGGECDRALAAGVNVILTPALHIFYAQAGLSAPDGRCKPFGAESNGIGRAEGVGALMLRRLDDAIADGDSIYAVVRGSAVNHDGRSNGITAPSRWAQIDVIERACAAADVRPQDIRFVEAHGTGTVLGDMIEVKALGQLHAGRDNPCLIGSVKGNIGHAEGAAGIAGLIKVALALHHKVLPPNRLTGMPNPQLRLAQQGLRLATEQTPLGSTTVLGAISSFGLGGTNAHAILASAPQVAPAVGANAGVFTVSGNDLAAVRRNAAAAGNFIGRAADVPIGELCVLSNRIKGSLPWRLAVAGDAAADLARTLRTIAADPSVAADLVRKPARRPRIGFIFTGQGSQHAGMTRRLLAESSHYRRLLVEADAAISAHLGSSIIDLIDARSAAVDNTEYAQPAIFAVQYALGRLLIELGIEPAVMLGHSIGEFTAACLGGALCLDDAARLVVRRGALMQGLPAGGGMLAVRLSADDVGALIDGDGRVAVAAVNGPRSVVLSGDKDRLEAIGTELAARQVATTVLNVSHAFHSPLMAPMLAEFELEAQTAHYGPGKIPIISTVTGNPVTGPAMDADYWTRQITEPVRFADAVITAVGTGVTHLLEIGPKSVLSSAVRQVHQAQAVKVLPVIDTRGAERVLELLAELYVDGASPNWGLLDSSARSGSVRLPAYQFSGESRFWHSQDVTAEAVATTVPADGWNDMASDPGDGPVESGHPVISVVKAVSGHDAARVQPHTRLHEDLGFDSVLLIELKNELERRVPAVAPLDIASMLPHILTVADLSRYIDDRITNSLRHNLSGAIAQ
jgi:acyl transferase domain-containing protein